MLNANLTVKDVLTTYPDAEDVFTWYGVEVTPEARKRTLVDFCSANGIDLEEFLTDLSAAIEDDVDEGEYEAEAEDEDLVFAEDLDGSPDPMLYQRPDQKKH